MTDFLYLTPKFIFVYSMSLKPAPAFIFLILFFLANTLAAQPGQIKECECPFDASRFPDSEVFCGKLTVPENREKPDGRMLEIMFTTLTPSNATEDPVVLLPGGPGIAPVGKSFLRIIDSYMPDDRTFIVFDPRGTGYSGPPMCRQLRQTNSLIAAMDLTLAEARQMKTGAILDCRNQLIQEGIDITMYNSKTIAHDVHDLMTALGYEQWNLYGGSYGVPFSRMIMRLYPENIRSVVITSGGDLDMRDFLLYDQRNTYDALTAVFRRCEKNPECNTAFPDLEQEFYQAYEKLENNPMKLAVSLDEFEFPEFTLNAYEFVQLIYFQLFDESRITHLPALIHAFAMQDQEVIRRAITYEYGSPASNFDSGMSIAVECIDHYTPEAFGDFQSYGEGLHPAFSNVPWFNLGCEYWAPEAAATQDMAPFKSDVPTMIIHGEHDPVSTREHAETHLPWFSKLQIFTTPGMAHGPPSPRERGCWKDLITRFMTDPEQPVDSSCLQSLPEVRITADLPEWAVE